MAAVAAVLTWVSSKWAHICSCTGMFAFGKVCLKQVQIDNVLNNLLTAEVCVIITRHLNL